MSESGDTVNTISRDIVNRLKIKDRVLSSYPAWARLRAERRCGQLLQNMKQKGERQKQGGNRRSKSHDATLKLADLGITKHQLRAERRCGELLKESSKNETRQKSGKYPRNGNPVAPLPKLADLGISKQQSSDWQKLAAVPEETFEELRQEDFPSTAELIRGEAEVVGPVSRYFLLRGRISA
jgi:hypothetical protein